jgi:hypothetical protein
MKTKIMKNFFTRLLFLLPTLTLAQSPKTFYIGHSLSDQIPDMVASLSNDHPELSFDDWRYQTIPGSPLRWSWETKDRDDYSPAHPFLYPFHHPVYGLPAGGYDILVLTESVPRYWSIIDETYQYADSFFVYATQYNPGIQVFLYEDWHCILSGTPTACAYDIDANPWRQRLSDDLPMWESVVDTLNSRFNPDPPVCLIPAGQGLAMLYDSIQAGVVPGVAYILDLFADDIHLTDVGKYFVACIHFAMIHNASPIGLTHQLNNMWGSPFNAPSPALALKLQQIAWQAVNIYPKTCLEGAISTVKQVESTRETIRIFPNPAADYIQIESERDIKSLKLFGPLGQFIREETGPAIDVSGLAPGVYWIWVNGEAVRFVKH